MDTIPFDLHTFLQTQLTLMLQQAGTEKDKILALSTELYNDKRIRIQKQIDNLAAAKITPDFFADIMKSEGEIVKDELLAQSIVIGGDLEKVLNNFAPLILTTILNFIPKP